MCLMKGLKEFYTGSPMAPPPPGWGPREYMDDEQITTITAESPSGQHLVYMHTSLQPQPNPFPTDWNSHLGTQPNVANIEYLRRQIAAAMREAIELPPQTQRQAINYAMALDGVSLERLMLGAALATVPGVQSASAVYTTVTSGAEKISRSVKRATNLSKSFGGVRVGCATDENLAGGWVEVSSQDIHGTD